MRFPVYLHETETGTYSGFVPDVMGCIFAGSTVDEALADAHDAISVHVEALYDHEMELPEAHTIQEHVDNEACKGGMWALVDVDLSKYDGKVVRINVTLPEHLLSRMDSYVEAHAEYGSRSGFIASMARKVLASV